MNLLESLPVWNSPKVTLLHHDLSASMEQIKNVHIVFTSSYVYIHILMGIYYNFIFRIWGRLQFHSRRDL